MTLSWGHEDLEAKGQLYHLGAHFEALFVGIFRAASDISCIFIRNITTGLEQGVTETLSFKCEQFQIST